MASLDKVLPLSCGVLLVMFAMHLDLGSTRDIMVPSTAVNCSAYNSSRPCLPGDRNVFCLANGTTVNGICEAQVAVCEEGASISDSMDPCTSATNNTDPDSGAVQMKATSSIFVCLLMTSSLIACMVWPIHSWISC